MDKSVENLTPVSVVQGRASIHRLYENRETHAFVFKLSGESRYDFEGGSILHGKNQMLLIPKGSNYKVTLTTPPPSEYLLINFLGEIPYTKIQEYPISGSIDRTRLCERISRLRAFESQAERYRCKAILYELFAMIEERKKVSKIGSGGENEIKKAVSYLHEHLFDPELKISDLHSLLGMSAPCFRSRFFTLFGVTPKKYVLGKRLTQAREILENGEFNNISEVAALVGFEDALYFGKMFKQQFGVNPSEVQKQKKCNI